MNTDRKPCPRCNRVGLRDGREWFCIEHGTYGITLYGWDSHGTVGGADFDAYAVENKRKRHLTGYVPIVPWTYREIEEWHTWQEGDPLPVWAESDTCRDERSETELCAEIVRLRALGWTQLQIAVDLGVDTNYISRRLRALREVAG